MELMDLKSITKTIIVLSKNRGGLTKPLLYTMLFCDITPMTILILISTVSTLHINYIFRIPDMCLEAFINGS